MSNSAHEILKDSIVIDCLFHGLFEDVPVEADDKITIVDLLLNGGVTAISDTMLDDNYPSGLAAAVKTMYNYYLLEDTLPNQVIIVKNSKDIVEAKKTGKLAVIMSTQGADVFEHDLRYISALSKLNLKIVQLTYNHQQADWSSFIMTRWGQAQMTPPVLAQAAIWSSVMLRRWLHRALAEEWEKVTGSLEVAMASMLVW